MKIEFDTSNLEECEMVQRMFSPLHTVDASLTQPIPEVEEMPGEAPPVVLGTLRDDNLPLVEPTPEVAGEMDKAGVPWDARIHSGGKTQNNNGTWKLRKGVDKALVEQIKGQLVSPPPVETPVDPPAQDPAQVFGSTPTLVPPTAPAVATLDWTTVCARVTPGISNGTHNVVAEAQFLAANGLANVHLLADRSDLFDAYLLAVGA